MARPLFLSEHDCVWFSFAITRRGNGWLSIGNIGVRVYDICLDDERRLSPSLLRLTRHYDEQGQRDGFSAIGSVEIMHWKDDIVIARHEVAFDCLYDASTKRFSIVGNHHDIATTVDGVWHHDPLPE